MLDTRDEARDAKQILGKEAIDVFQARLQGQLIRPGDADYDAARAVWNGMIDKRPALIARCARADDVIASVNFARENGLLVAVRGGGHNVAGSATCDGGLVIDLSPMKEITVDPEARIASVEGGVTWGELDRETQAFGLAAPGGLISDTGIAGLTLGGGFGWLRRKYGLSCDNLVAAEVVTADGRLVRASNTENADLLWGLRGGGGNFGIVTRFEFALHPVGPEVMFCIVFYPLDAAREALRLYRDYAASSPDEVSSIAFFGTMPAIDMFPQSAHGQPYLAVLACHCGSVEEGERIMQPLREFATPIVDLSDHMPFVEAQKFFDEDYPSHVLRYYWKSAYLESLDDEVIDRLIDLSRKRLSDLSTIDIWQMGGAMSRVGPTDTAFSTRYASFMLGIEANWERPEDDEKNIAWAREVAADMEQFSDGSQYFNFAGFLEDIRDAVRVSFKDNYDRLLDLKNKYDPDNLFRLNQNIRPTA